MDRLRSPERRSQLCRLGVASSPPPMPPVPFPPVEVAGAASPGAEECSTHNAFTLIDHERRSPSARRGGPWRPDRRPRRSTGCRPPSRTSFGRGRASAMAASRRSPFDVAGCAGRRSPAGRRRRLPCLTTTPEFGWKAVTDSPRSGVTTNPWNAALTPGGSSGGAALPRRPCGVLHLGSDGAARSAFQSPSPALRYQADVRAGFRPIRRARLARSPMWGRWARKPRGCRGDARGGWPVAIFGLDAAAGRAAVARRLELQLRMPHRLLASLAAWHGEPEVAARIDSVVDRLRAAGARVEPLDLPITTTCSRSSPPTGNPALRRGSPPCRRPAGSRGSGPPGGRRRGREIPVATTCYATSVASPSGRQWTRSSSGSPPAFAGDRHCRFCCQEESRPAPASAAGPNGRLQLPDQPEPATRLLPPCGRPATAGRSACSSSARGADGRVLEAARSSRH
jgi:hypothetical protein